MKISKKILNLILLIPIISTISFFNLNSMSIQKLTEEELEVFLQIYDFVENNDLNNLKSLFKKLSSLDNLTQIINSQNPNNSYGNTPLFIATYKSLHEEDNKLKAQYIEIIKLLIKKGAKITKKNKNGATPIIIAETKENTKEKKIYKTLLKHTYNALENNKKKFWFF